MKPSLCCTVLLACASIAAMANNSARAAEIGIDRSNLVNQSDAVQEKTLRDIHDLGAKWFRDGPSSPAPQDITRFVNEVRLVKQNHLKMLFIVFPSYADYDASFANARRRIPQEMRLAPRLRKIEPNQFE
jgi:hypothetical protein